MPRPPRVQFAGAVYHLMNRGVRGEDLYTDAREHAHFLALLAETCVRYEWITLQATSKGARAIRAEGRTNLPDGAVLSLSASRAFRNAHEHDVRAVNAAEDSATVSGGAFSAVLKLNEGTLLVGLDVDKSDPSMGPIATIDSAVTVCADFETGKNLDDKPRQPDADVRDTVGEFGERLRGSPQVTVFGSATPTPANWLEVKRRVVLQSPLLGRIERVQGRRPRLARLAGFCLS